jgi:hypothetical protein
LSEALEEDAPLTPSGVQVGDSIGIPNRRAQKQTPKHFLLSQGRLAARIRNQEGEQPVTHQPAISFSTSFQHPFNRAGGRTSNVLQ